MLDRDESLESNPGDPELLIYIPFNSAVKMKSLTMIGGEDGTSPAIIKVFVNKENPDFDLIEGCTLPKNWNALKTLRVNCHIN